MWGQANRPTEPGMTIKNVIFKNNFKPHRLMHSAYNLNIVNIHTFGGLAVKTRWLHGQRLDHHKTRALHG